MADTEKKPDVAENETPETDAAAEAAAEETSRFETEVESIGPCKVSVKIRVPLETVKAELDDRYQEIIRTVAFPGFRLGHAPRRLVEKKLGEDVLGDVKGNLISDSFKAAIKDHDLDPISEPDVDLAAIDFAPDKPFEYSATLILRPTVEVPDYSTISIEAVQPVVSEERVDEVLEDMRRRHAMLEPAPDGRVGAGDVVVLDVVARVGDDKVMERENTEYVHPMGFLGGMRFASLADAILGAGPETELTVTEKLPDTWPNEEHAGKDLVAEIKVNAVKRHVLPELNDKFAEEMDFDSLEELRTEIRSQVRHQAEHEATDATDRRLVDALIAAAPFDLPEEVVKEETTRRVARVMSTLRMRGARDEEVEEKVAEAMSAERTVVERDFRSGFLLDAIAKKEKVFVTESEVDERVAQMAAVYNRTPQEMREHLEQRDMLSSVRTNMREEKVIAILRNKVKIEGIPAGDAEGAE